MSWLIRWIRSLWKRPALPEPDVRAVVRNDGTRRLVRDTNGVKNY